MGRNDENRQFDNDYASVAARYRAFEQEKAPESLGKQIAKNAARAARQTSSLPSINRWLKPLTAVATLSITAALVLQVDHLVTVPVERIDENAAQAAGTALRDAGLPTLDAANAAANSVNGTPESTSNSISINRGRSTDAGSILPDEQACSPQQRARPSTWWACIQTLESRGLSAAATQELTAILETFPTFKAPNDQR